MTSDGGFDWFAFGLHEDESGGMLDAEVFMCSPEVSNLNGQFCQNRNTKAGHKTPALDKVNYEAACRLARLDKLKRRIFSKIAKSKRAVMSYGIQNASVMVIFARGAWKGGPMPSGVPLRRVQDTTFKFINFYSGEYTI